MPARFFYDSLAVIVLTSGRGSTKVISKKVMVSLAKVNLLEVLFTSLERHDPCFDIGFLETYSGYLTSFWAWRRCRQRENVTQVEAQGARHVISSSSPIRSV